jgi:hypothetical protein
MKPPLRGLPVSVTLLVRYYGMVLTGADRPPVPNSFGTCLSFFGFCAPRAKYPIGGAGPHWRASPRLRRRSIRLVSTRPWCWSRTSNSSGGSIDAAATKLGCGEHHSAGTEISASPEIFIAVASQRTSRIKLDTGVVSVAYHNPCGSPNALSSSGSPRPRDAGGWTRLFTNRRCDDRNFAVTDPRSRRRSWHDHEIAHLRGTGDLQGMTDGTCATRGCISVA